MSMSANVIKSIKIYLIISFTFYFIYTFKNIIDLYNLRKSYDTINIQKYINRNKYERAIILQKLESINNSIKNELQ